MHRLKLKISPPIQILVTAILMRAVSFIDIPALPIPFIWRGIITGIILVVGGMILTFGVWQYGKAKTTWLPNDPLQSTALVTDGIYRFSRNPMYLTWTIILIGRGIFLGGGLTLFLVPVFMLTMARLQIIPEEKALEELFGDEFRTYKQKVRRWI